VYAKFYPHSTRILTHCKDCKTLMVGRGEGERVVRKRRREGRSDGGREGRTGAGKEGGRGRFRAVPVGRLVAVGLRLPAATGLERRRDM